MGQKTQKISSAMLMKNFETAAWYTPFLPLFTPFLQSCSTIGKRQKVVFLFEPGIPPWRSLQKPIHLQKGGVFSLFFNFLGWLNEFNKLIKYFINF